MMNWLTLGLLRAYAARGHNRFRKSFRISCTLAGFVLRPHDQDLMTNLPGGGEGDSLSESVRGGHVMNLLVERATSF
jgi:hypothetical protein